MPRLLLCPVRPPVMRWPVRLNLPSFLIDVDIGELAGLFAFTWRRPGSAGAKALEDAADPGCRDTRLLGDVLPVMRSLDPGGDGRRGRTI